jgi:tetratricopeptide (TPR) repeat protein
MINVAELDERIDRCLAILADNPHSQVFAALAEAYRRRGEFGRAFSVCKSGLKHHPDYGPAHVVLAKLYLHQKMLPDALSSLRRAVELDGSTRVTDVLEAEVYLAHGDVDAAQTVIDRLRVTDPGNPSLPDFLAQLKQLRSGPSNPTSAAVVDEPASPEPHASFETRPTPEPIDWRAWVEMIGALRGIEVAYVFDDQGQLTAGYPESRSARARMDGVLNMVRGVTTHLPSGSWGSLCEVRVEAGRGDVWAKQWGSVIIGFVGSRDSSFGSARQRGLELAGRVQAEPSSLPAAAM